MQWLKQNLGIISDLNDCESIVREVYSDNRITFVPAFAGLYAPYWRKDARRYKSIQLGEISNIYPFKNPHSVICGITEDTTSAHIIKAALQSVCFQTRDILEAMKKDTGLTLSKLLVDGGMTSNNLLMQMQADICGMPVGKFLLIATRILKKLQTIFLVSTISGVLN